MPMPNSAVMIGRPIASTEPNAISRMTMAARMPIASLENAASSREDVAAELDLRTRDVGALDESARLAHPPSCTGRCRDRRG